MSRNLGTLLIGGVVAYGIALLNRSKSRSNKARVEDFTPTTLATQGSFIPRLLGRMRVGCVFAWAGDRIATPFAAGTTTGGKGSRKKNKNAKQLVYTEAGWHALCIGPAWKLYKIWADGKVIWEGEIDRVGTPSGTAVQLATGEEFVIYWGEVNQPINTFLSSATRVGIASRWPYVCYIQWTNKGLGSQPRWPTMEYELEVRVEQSTLDSDSGAYITGPPAGPNPAHVLAELLWAPFPHGLGFDQDEWDQQFLADFAEECEELGLPACVYASDGEEAQDVIARIMQDHGLMLRWNPRSTTAVAGDCADIASYADPVPWASFCETYTLVNGDEVSDWDDVFNHMSWANFNVVGLEPRLLTDEEGQTYLEFETGERLHNQSLPGSGINTQGEVWCIVRFDQAGNILYSANDEGVLSAQGMQFGTLDLGDGLAYPYIYARSNSHNQDNRVRTTRGFPLGEKMLIRWWADGATWKIFVNGEEEPLTVYSGTNTGDWYSDFVAINEIWLGRGDLRYFGTFFAGALWRWLQFTSNLTDEQAAAFQDSFFTAGYASAYQFVRLREPCLDGALFDGLPRYYPVPATMIEGPLPEIEQLHGERATDRLLFGFVDRSREYRRSTIAISDDAQAIYLEVQRARTVDISSAADYEVAAILAERRSAEELGPQIKNTLNLNKGARALLPGDRISVSGFPYVLRILEVQLRPGGGARVVAMQDAYGVPAADPVSSSGGGTTGPSTPAAADAAFTFVEVPQHLLGAPGSPPAIVVPRLRANVDQRWADLWISPDGTSYQLTEREFDLQQGGTLTQQIDADTAWHLPTSAEFTTLGPDIAQVEDLSSLTTDWRLGRQIALIGEELFFLKKVTFVSGSTYRLDGLIRARYDTERAAHAIGDKVFIFRSAEIEYVQDPLLVPGTVLRVKTQPYASTALSLASVTAESKTLAGKGIVPMRPAALRVVAPHLGCFGWSTGNDISFRWAHRSAQVIGTGAGMQAAGKAVGSSALLGTFEIRLLTTGDVLKRTVTQTSPTYTYANADLSTDFGGEPSAFKIEVREINGGYRSPAITATLTRT